MLKQIVVSSMVVLALGFAACDEVPTDGPESSAEIEFDPSFDVSGPPDGGTCPDVFYEKSRLLSNGVTLTWTSTLAGFDYTEGEDYMVDVNWSVDQGSATYQDFTKRNGRNTWTPKRVDGLMTAGAAGDGTVPVTVNMFPMHAAGERDDEDDDGDDGEDGDDDWAGKIGNGHFWLRLLVDDGEGGPKRVKLGVNFHLEDPADGYGTNCPGDEPPVEPPVDPPANLPPTADAGPDDTVTDTDEGGDENVTLDGSGSSDPDGTIVSYSWTEGVAEIATGVNPTVAFAVGEHTVTLTVADDDGATDTDEVVITVNAPGANLPPTADAGPNQTVEDTDDNGGEDLVLDGSGSSDSDGTIVSYSWTEGVTEIATGVNPTVAFAVGEHNVTLTVTDNEGATDTDAVVITVEAAPPAGISFAVDIQPYFEAGLANCVRCHSGGSPPAGVSLDSYAGVIAADPAGSLEDQLLANHQNGPDDEGFVVTLRQWVSDGSQNN